MSCPHHGHDDALADAMAAVHAVRNDDTAGLAVLLRHGNPMGMTVTLAKLLAEVLEEQDITPGHFRHWAAHAARRSG